MKVFVGEYTEGDADPKMGAHKRLVNEMSRLLAGNNPAVMGGVLVELLAKFVAGHDPALRKEVFDATVKAAKGLVPIMAIEVALYAKLKDWDGGVDDAPAAAAAQQ